MNYQILYQESNEQAEERFCLVKERIAGIAGNPEIDGVFSGYFKKTAVFILKLAEICEKWESGQLFRRTMEECEAINQALYGELMEENYTSSYANPTYAKEVLGSEDARALTLLLTHIRQNIESVFRGDKLRFTVSMELFVEIYNHYLEETVQAERIKSVSQTIYWYFHDYSEIFEERSIRRLLDAKEDFETSIVMESDLSDLTYLYSYGAYIGADERGMAEFLNTLPEEKIQAMADTYTEGFCKGFELGGKDLSKKQTVQIRYPIGFERVVRAAVKNFAKVKLKTTMFAIGISVNRQYDYDHREDRAYYMDKAYVERCLEVKKTSFEEYKEMAAKMAGPAVIQVFGEEPFAPKQKEEAIRYSEKQQQLRVYEMSMAGQITNQYIKGEERSFTIIAYPIPAIGEHFPEIFAETVKINTLDYVWYRDMQQKMIDVLDTAERVHITGKGENKTDLYVSIWPVRDGEKETAFENCVADVNIPVGEVFTSPVLKGTTGKLFVSQVYLKGLSYHNLELDFEDGMIVHYTCTNFEDEKENQKYIRENLLMHHDTLPMGEFAIGTNTAAYRMAREFQIADKLPILIAEKTGPHFAVGDTCYCHEEDNISYNPDGKAIVARENCISAQRKENMDKAYFNCHTDITIPYDELDRITAIGRDGSAVDIISDGRFALEGTRELNEPLDSL